jgi:hypothetical protein
MSNELYPVVDNRIATGHNPLRIFIRLGEGGNPDTRCDEKWEDDIMTTTSRPSNVGVPDPELKTSPILEEGKEDYELVAQGNEEDQTCYFNNQAYTDGDYVCSGSGILLRCEKGIWVREGGCDPDNP